MPIDFSHLPRLSAEHCQAFQTLMRSLDELGAAAAYPPDRGKLAEKSQAVVTSLRTCSESMVGAVLKELAEKGDLDQRRLQQLLANCQGHFTAAQIKASFTNHDDQDAWRHFRQAVASLRQSLADALAPEVEAARGPDDRTMEGVRRLKVIFDDDPDMPWKTAYRAAGFRTIGAARKAWKRYKRLLSDDS